jgi:hypothetical protein
MPDEKSELRAFQYPPGFLIDSGELRFGFALFPHKHP